MIRPIAASVGLVVLAVLIGYSLHLTAENATLHDDLRVIAMRLDRIQPLLAKVRHNSARLDDMSRAAYLTQLSRHDAPVGPRDLGEKLNDEPEAGSDRPLPGGEALPPSDADAFASIVVRLKDLGAGAQSLDTKLGRVQELMQGRSVVVENLPTLMPAKGPISSEFGMRMSPISGEPLLHKGFDIAAPEGSPVVAPADGVVRFAGKFGGFGNYVSIVHANGIVTKFGHNAEVLVKAGDSVKRGQRVASVGNSGRSTGIHLHFEVWVNNQPVDPRRFVDDPSLARAHELMGPDAAFAPGAALEPAGSAVAVEPGVFDLHDPVLVAELYADADPEVKRHAVLGYLRATAPRTQEAGQPPAFAFALMLFLGGCLFVMAVWHALREIRHRQLPESDDAESLSEPSRLEPMPYGHLSVAHADEDDSFAEAA